MRHVQVSPIVAARCVRALKERAEYFRRLIGPDRSIGPKDWQTELANIEHDIAHIDSAMKADDRSQPLFAEIVFDLSQLAQAYREQMPADAQADSREMFRLILSWAEEFRDTVDRPDDDTFSYMDEVDGFFAKKLNTP